MFLVLNDNRFPWRSAEHTEGAEYQIDSRPLPIAIIAAKKVCGDPLDRATHHNFLLDDSITAVSVLTRVCIPSSSQPVRLSSCEPCPPSSFFLHSLPFRLTRFLLRLFRLRATRHSLDPRLLAAS